MGRESLLYCWISYLRKKKNTSCLGFHQLSINLGKAVKEGFIEEELPLGSIARWKVAENSGSVLLVHG